MLSPRFNTNSKSILNLSEIQKNHEGRNVSPNTPPDLAKILSGI